MRNEKDIFVGEIKKHLSNASAPTHRPKRHNRILRFIGGGSTLAVALKAITVFTVVGMLIGLLGSYIVTQEYGFNVGGGIAPSILIDGIELTDPTYSMPADAFSDGILIPGETEEFIHNFSSPSNDGNWTVYWNISQDMNWFENTSSPYYGVYFWTLNDTGMPIDHIDVLRGTVVNVTYRFMLDSHFQTIGSDTVPFKLILYVEALNQVPTASNFSVVIPWNVWTEFNVIELSNAFDYENETLTVTAIQPGGMYIQTALINDEVISLYTGSGGSFYDIPVWVDISDGDNTIRVFMFVSKN